MTEPDVAITDFLLGILCLVFARRLGRLRGARSASSAAWIVFFAGTSVAAASGGVFHGFFAHDSTFAAQALWTTTMLTAGCVIAASWVLFGSRMTSALSARQWAVASSGVLFTYSGIILFVSQEFWVTVVAEGLPLVGLLGSALLRFFRNGARPDAFLAAGIALSLLSGALQVLRVAIDRDYFDHNSTFHLAQAAAISLMYVSAYAEGAVKHESRLGDFL